MKIKRKKVVNKIQEYQLRPRTLSAVGYWINVLFSISTLLPTIIAQNIMIWNNTHNQLHNKLLKMKIIYDPQREFLRVKTNAKPWENLADLHYIITLYELIHYCINKNH